MNEPLDMHQDFNFASLELRTPRPNKEATSLSALADKRPKVQLGEIEAPCCTFRKVVDDRYLHIHLKTNSVRTFMSDVEETIMGTVGDHAEEWFKKKLTALDVRRMLCSIVTADWDIVVKRSRAMQCYQVIKGTNDVQNIEVQDVPENSLCIPILQFEGIFIGRRHYSLSFNIQHLLILETDDTPDEDYSAFILFDNEDLEDPHSHSVARQDNETGSFETQVFVNPK